MTDQDFKARFAAIDAQLRELGVGIRAVDSKMDAKTQTLAGRVTALETKSAIDQVHRENVESRLGNIEDTLKWLVRLIIGALVLAIVAFALGGGFNVSV